MGVLQPDWHGLTKPWSIRPCITGVMPNKASQRRGFCFPLSHVCQGFIWTITGLAFLAHPTSPWAQTSGFTLERLIYSVWRSLSLAINIIILCPLSKGIPVFSLSPNIWILTPNLCKTPLPSKGIRHSGTYRKEWVICVDPINILMVLWMPILRPSLLSPLLFYNTCHWVCLIWCSESSKWHWCWIRMPLFFPLCPASARAPQGSVGISA